MAFSPCLGCRRGTCKVSEVPAPGRPASQAQGRLPGPGQGCASGVAAPELMPRKVRAENLETADCGLLAFLNYLTAWFEGKTQSAAVTQGARRDRVGWTVALAGVVRGVPTRGASPPRPPRACRGRPRCTPPSPRPSDERTRELSYRANLLLLF